MLMLQQILSWQILNKNNFNKVHPVKWKDINDVQTFTKKNQIPIFWNCFRQV